MTRYGHLTFVTAALSLSLVVTYTFVQQPAYTDAYYYMNGANRLVNGHGLTEVILWNYIGMPESLPAPSHTYWMPMTSFIAAAGMWVLRAPEAYWAAQIPFALLLTVLAYCAFWLGEQLGGTRRHAWFAGLMLIAGGFFIRVWGMTETFTPYGVFGSGCLIALGRGMNSRHIGWFLLAGALGAAGHLTRADGLLLILAGGAAIWWRWDQNWSLSRRLVASSILIVGYFLVISPWMIRNLSVIGTPLPTGGTQGIWYTEYNDIFSYPPDATPERFFDIGGWSLFWESRWLATRVGFGTLVAVEGMVVLFPFMLIGLFRRLREPFLRPFWVYALGLHLAMTLVFPFPGYRGGLFHSAAALMPFWVALGVVGLDDAIDWMAKRRHWNPLTAKPVFTSGILIMVITLSLFIGLGMPFERGTPDLYPALQDLLPIDARVMINDPSALYYFTGLWGVQLPNETPDVIPEIATRYGITHLVLEEVNEDLVAGAATTGMADIPANLPPFLQPIPLEDETVRVYQIELAN